MRESMGSLRTGCRAATAARRTRWVGNPGIWTGTLFTERRLMCLLLSACALILGKAWLMQGMTCIHLTPGRRWVFPNGDRLPATTALLLTTSTTVHTI
jgi:hypothetical protein